MGQHGKHRALVGARGLCAALTAWALTLLAAPVMAECRQALALGLDVSGSVDLREYWLHGKGALKIRWGTGGDWTRCHRYMLKYMNPYAAKGACSNLHKIATGMWPGDKRNR